MQRVFMLDTDICSYIIRRKPKELEATFAKYQDAICISVITYAELQYGILNRQSVELEKQVNDFISLVEVVDWTDAAARQYAKIRCYLTKSGLAIGNMDIMIAAAALAMGASLVTNNTKHFSVIPGMQMANWLQTQ